jgi:hypothetical protein
MLNVGATEPTVSFASGLTVCATFETAPRFAKPTAAIAARTMTTIVA